MAQFTIEEQNIINSGNADTPFQVLLTTNTKDSLFLRQKSTNIDTIVENADLQLLIQRLATTMEMESGVGIAAPQVGVSKNVFLFTRIDKPDYPVWVAINPRIIDHPKETICFEGDGCLSIPNARGTSIRYPWVEVEYTNQDGEVIRERLDGFSRGDDFTGVIFQHEYDHLQGILFIDKLCIQDEEK